MSESWGWWRNPRTPRPEDALVVADWMEAQGQLAWARWFRSEASEAERLAWFFGEGVSPGQVERVLCGAIPVSVPSTAFDGPWFAALHVISRGPETFDFDELAEVPCMARVAELVVHGAGVDPRLVERVPGASITLAELAPLARTLTGLWVLDGHLDPGGLSALPHLRTLGVGLGRGHWAHPTLRHLAVSAVPEQGATLALPSLRSLDLDLGPGVDLAPLLSRELPALESLELDEPLVPQVAAAHRAGVLPRLRELRVWGEARLALEGVRMASQGPYSRRSIRLTSDWVFDRGIALPR